VLIRLTLLLATAAAVLSWGASLLAQAPAAPAPSSPPLRKVAAIHTELCASCHGAKWEGGRAPSMLDDVWAHGGDDESLARSIRAGVLANGMPAFEAVLKGPEIRALVIAIREARDRARREGTPAARSFDDLVVASELHSFKIERVADGLDTPWGLAFLPDGRMLVSERPGRLRIVEPGRGVVASISGLPPVWLQQDGGLFDVAVHPDYARTGWVYLSFSEAGALPGSSATRVIRGRIRDGALVDQETLFQPSPAQFWVSNIHYGSRFLFDRDGYLYFSIGDRGRPGESQDLGSPYGKLHRVRDDGRPAEGNPFLGRPAAVESIWSYGHRNQQGLAQHPLTGELWASEHGPRGGDELNLVVPARNYGWPLITYGMNDDGTPITDLTAREGLEQPVVHWTPSIGVAALEFYTGDKFPAWKNQLFATALPGRQLRRLQLEGHRVVHQEILFSGLGRVRDVVTGPDGFLYISLNAEFGSSPGHIIRLVPTTPPARP
jgi:aldose sugar dehydrogenase